MNSKAMAPALLLSACMAVLAQGPLSDTVTVNIPQMTRVGNQTLPAGDYQIRQLPTASNPRLLEFSSDSGTKLEAAITTIAALDNNNQNETSVILVRQGSEYFLKYVWIKGKSYGYEIPVDKTNVASAPAKTMRLTALYTPAAEPQIVAEVKPKPLPAPAPQAPAADVAPEPQPAASPEPAPAPTPEPVAQAAPAPERTAPQAEQLPATASNQAGIALAGLTMAAIGLLIRRFNRIAH